MPKKPGTKPGADNSRGDKITVGNITKSTGVAIGRGAQATATQTIGVSAEEIAKAFAAITAKVNTLPEGPDKSVAASAVQALQVEAQKGDKASEANVKKWFDFLAQTSSDAFDVAVATFSNPIAGMSVAFKKIAERAKADRQAKK
jgi:hypothetical protein